MRSRSIYRILISSHQINNIYNTKRFCNQTCSRYSCLCHTASLNHLYFLNFQSIAFGIFHEELAMTWALVIFLKLNLPLGIINRLIGFPTAQERATATVLARKAQNVGIQSYGSWAWKERMQRLCHMVLPSIFNHSDKLWHWLIYLFIQHLFCQDIILISIDTLRADHLSVYDYHEHTSPNLRKWVQQKSAHVFKHAYNTAPWTRPSHSAMLTGMPPEATGIFDEIYWLRGSCWENVVMLWLFICYSCAFLLLVSGCIF